MSTDVLVLNTAAVDFRSSEFEFAEKMVGSGGLTKWKTEDMPDYTQQQLNQFIQNGQAVAGGSGNTAPLMARTGLKVAVGANLGSGDFDGLDAHGRFFYDVMAANNVDVSQFYIHPKLPTGCTFIYDKKGDERGGLAFFPNANNDFDFERFKGSVEKLNPKIVYYIYSGLSDRGDANGGKDLAEFIKWCRSKGSVTIVDSHTYAGEPQKLAEKGTAVKEYKLLEPLLGQVDLFFTSSDEAKMIENTIGTPKAWKGLDEDGFHKHFLGFLAEKFWTENGSSRMFGVTVSNGAYEKHCATDGNISEVKKIESRFMAGEVIDLVGAGDSFRAGFLSYVANNVEKFKNGELNFDEAVSMGNLFAALYIKAPLDDRYGNIRPYENMLKSVTSKVNYRSFSDLLEQVNS